LPGVLYSCARNAGITERSVCDYASLVAQDWPLWLAIAIGSVASRALATHGDGANRVLRAAGALAAAMTATFSLGALALFLVVLPTAPSSPVLGFMGLSDIAI